jgi:hypothetical protein
VEKISGHSKLPRKRGFATILSATRIIVVLVVAAVVVVAVAATTS